MENKPKDISSIKDNILDDFKGKLDNITVRINLLKNNLHNLSSLKIKEYNILRGMAKQLKECIKTVENI